MGETCAPWEWPMCPGPCGTEIFVGGHSSHQDREYRCHKCDIAFSRGRWEVGDPDIADSGTGTIDGDTLARTLEELPADRVGGAP